ncbi:MAG: hypothetical protein LM587_03295, partial [Candidatus Aenigmarchaeota archaeon]|nr:hypothetical protein [Candidatus Aenigmarchaeota archaeon]
MDLIEKLKSLKGVGYKKLKEAGEKKVELPGFLIKKVASMQELPSVENVTSLNITYPILEPFAYVNIKWDDSQKMLIYNVIEPELSEDEKKKLEKISKALVEMVDVGLEEIKDENRAIEYVK